MASVIKLLPGKSVDHQSVRVETHFGTLLALDPAPSVPFVSYLKT